MKMADFKITVSMNYFKPSDEGPEYVGTVMCLPDGKFMLVATDDTRKLMPKGSRYNEAAQLLLEPWTTTTTP